MERSDYNIESRGFGEERETMGECSMPCGKEKAWQAELFRNSMPSLWLPGITTHLKPPIFLDYKIGRMRIHQGYSILNDIEVPRITKTRYIHPDLLMRVSGHLTVADDI